VALAEVVLAAGLQQRPVDGVHARALAFVEEQVGHPHFQGGGDGGERLQMRGALSPLDHGEEGDADARALAQILLGHARGARHAELADPAPDFPDDSRLYHSLPRSPPPAADSSTRSEFPYQNAARILQIPRVKIHSQNVENDPSALRSILRENAGARKRWASWNGKLADSCRPAQWQDVSKVNNALCVQFANSAGVSPGTWETSYPARNPSGSGLEIPAPALPVSAVGAANSRAAENSSSMPPRRRSLELPRSNDSPAWISSPRLSRMPAEAATTDTSWSFQS